MRRTQQRDDKLRLAALEAVRRANELADEIDDIVENSLSPFASRALRADLRRLADRQRDISGALAREVDGEGDVEVVRHLSRALRRGAALFLSGSVFAGGALTTGALEDLGADLKTQLLAHVAGVDRASQEVELEAERLEQDYEAPAAGALPSPRSATARLLEAWDQGDAEALAMELGILVRFEPLLKDLAIASARSAVGDEWWSDFRQSVEEDDSGQWTDVRVPRSPQEWALQDVIRLLRWLDGQGHLPGLLVQPLAHGWPMERVRTIVDLRNRYAHGQLPPAGSDLSTFVGRADLEDLGILYDRLNQ